jgi:DNA-binding transcriptional ArsR family regulator
VRISIKDEPKKFMPMRKGIADAVARAEVSKSIITRFTEHMSAVEEKTRLGDLLNSVDVPLVHNGKRVRALDVFGKDKALLRAISDPAFNVHAITNKELQEILKGTPWAKNMTGKQLSGRISRHLRLLREHGLIEKLPNQRKYALTDKGRKITAALDAVLYASVNDLLKFAA